jgi:hypothetical protein
MSDAEVPFHDPNIVAHTRQVEVVDQPTRLLQSGPNLQNAQTGKHTLIQKKRGRWSNQTHASFATRITTDWAG